MKHINFQQKQTVAISTFCWGPRWRAKCRKHRKEYKGNIFW